MGFCRSSARCAAQLFSSLLLICSFALVGFGTYILYKWRGDPTTQALPPPNYVWFLLGFGAALGFSNLLSICGASSRTRWCMGVSVCLSFILLILQLVIIILLFADPSMVDQEVCPEDDTVCLEKLNNLFKDPAQHAGVLLSVVCAIQIMAMCSTTCLKDLEWRKERRDDDEEAALERPLREEDWDERQAAIERKAQRKLDLHKEALSATARQALEVREKREGLLGGWGSPSAVRSPAATRSPGTGAAGRGSVGQSTAV
mmetsp:Transcript_31944/g.62361  ORF Transcript_31944/g.62361 Transcript_31944/m.62361 type:complete len:259 (-) Transcript_31944:216-992(-)|eukprot:CAMPEP_0173392648 /NCGR_PEP_ID=MMETSP1356-20130122/20480_1 /TAXON_ID=77927 ORGANISM="Hemiselmis virescens, Strain PCC157" /NCGR_SAMPLE_ID=MMETSP1356 /ASSEMBLY_ACC=CAM_ASM_000847 /LENGTH=258 /DNA_ID=CAMNT_0014350503 /DNA_START=196 /DNA_END=972 /DNA_ORIENTATION=+